MGLVGAIPILFGTNIGTTVTALLASIGGSVNAKRTAIAHTLFNVGGTLLFIWFTPYIAEFIQAISPDGNELNVISRQIANAHLCFNIATTIVFIPLIGGLVHVVEKLIPGHDAERDPMDPIYLDTICLTGRLQRSIWQRKNWLEWRRFPAKWSLKQKKRF